MDKNLVYQIINDYAVPALGAIIALIVGLFIIKKIVKVFNKQMTKKYDDATLAKFLSNLMSWILKIALFIAIAGMVGIQTTSFVAIIGAVGLAVGLALQGTLANFAGGVLLLVFKPYRVGDVVSAQGETGKVKEIQLFTTIIVTPDNHTIYLPNGAVMNGNIKNLTQEGKLRMDIAIGIAYESSIKEARKILLDVVAKYDNILKDPEPTVTVGELGDSAVTLNIRPWAKVEDYWGIYFSLLEEGKEALEAGGIKIPYPQHEVYITKQS